MSPPRIIAGSFKGRNLITPAGLTTRPTSGRARQAAFDILLHTAWAGPAFIHTARVLDVFAGTGAFGLEALSRGAASATFIELARDAQAAIKANITACKMQDKTRIIAADALRPPPGHPHDLIFLDPPYGQNLLPRALHALALTGWFAPGAIIAAELGPEDSLTPTNVLAERSHGKAKLLFWRSTP
ncbi:MAG: 16S rRNA (guanine(966)-N(2))-methyltransferase RsmD [Acidocella sp. 20-57-95]|nr:MAG: 16S rRNA (guanine(966)-N(2))-methyltransferase RsmD [Acidocella sp. 20-57-95]OYV62215.1 MAG: 16S rRNA (guanine(966)-N(2))-methyltransferase RsmD [Acidocella sp. 21-58-7]HQT63747.1 16S rRNA (guanine(966)-N(2))-methyltransferase RsmD [Acidocella sp.]HQU03123.1 16S rRNA (guanine(966)-N(2))-methyltransferase RsmD [Acidocella sp.]